MTRDLDRYAGDVGGDLMGGPAFARTQRIRGGAVDGGEKSVCFDGAIECHARPFRWARCTDARFTCWLVERSKCVNASPDLHRPTAIPFPLARGLYLLRIRSASAR